jgi:hypothetical protein
MNTKLLLVAIFGLLFANTALAKSKVFIDVNMIISKPAQLYSMPDNSEPLELVSSSSKCEFVKKVNSFLLVTCVTKDDFKVMGFIHQKTENQDALVLK